MHKPGSHFPPATLTPLSRPLLKCVQVCVDGCSGAVNTFIVEPFIPHDAEYYLSMQSERLGNVISFSDAGGVEIEENWGSVKAVTILTLEEASGDALAPLLGGLPLELRPQMEVFIQAVYAVRRAVDALHVLRGSVRI